MRLKRIPFFTCVLMISLTLFSSCKKDNEIKTTVLSPTVDDNRYTGGGTLKFMYSTDDGKNWQTNVPQMDPGTTLLVKLNNETADLTSEDFTFDWSNSSLAPVDATTDVARFNVQSANFQIYVIVADKVLLVSSSRSTGVFYSIDTLTGAKTELFTPKLNNEPVLGIRGFVFHTEKIKFYASTSTNEGGTIYEIDPATKAATVINNNNSGSDPEWYAVANFVVLPDDSLMGVGWLKDPDKNVLMKFGTDGKKSPRSFDLGLCCGLGMIYETGSEQLIISDDAENGSMRLVRTEVDGEVIDSRDIFELNNFPTDITNVWLATKCLAKSPDGKTFAIMYNYDTKESYFVRVDASGPKVTYLATLGADVNNQYNSLAFIPKYSL